MQRFVIYIMLLLSIVSCSNDGNVDGQKLKVVVSIVPYKDFVESVGGDDVSVSVLIPAGASPHTYELTAQQMAVISKSDIYFKVGGNFHFEKEILDKLSEGQSSLQIKDCSEGINFIDDNPHIWLGQPQVKQIINNICNGLSEHLPEKTAGFRQNLGNFLSKLDSADVIIKNELSEYSDRNFLVYHGAWGYYAKQYDLNELAIEKEGKEPGVQSMLDLINTAKRLGIRYLYIGPNQNPESAIAIANEIGAEIDVLNTLPERYLEYQLEIIDKLKRDFKK